MTREEDESNISWGKADTEDFYGGKKKARECACCKWLETYVAESGDYINVCEAEGPEDVADGMYRLTAVDVDIFDASECLGFLKE